MTTSFSCTKTIALNSKTIAQIVPQGTSISIAVPHEYTDTVTYCVLISRHLLAKSCKKLDGYLLDEHKLLIHKLHMSFLSIKDKKLLKDQDYGSELTYTIAFHSSTIFNFSYFPLHAHGGTTCTRGLFLHYLIHSSYDANHLIT